MHDRRAEIREGVFLNGLESVLRQLTRARLASMRTLNFIDAARQTANVGLELPAMGKLTGLKRTVATQAGKAFLRLAQLVTRDQRSFNDNVVKALAELREQNENQTQLIRALTEVTRDVLTAQVRATESGMAGLERETEMLRVHATRLEHEAKTRGDAVWAQILDLQKENFGSKEEFRWQQSVLTRLRTSAESWIAEPTGVTQETMVRDLARVDDNMYFNLEERFRGSHDAIKERLTVYLDYLRAATKETQGKLIADIGCGRGEMLELLRDNHLKAVGIDSNDTMVETCRALGLEAVAATFATYFGTVANGSLSAITGIHVIEHVPFAVLIALFDDALRTLAPGGMVIFETPNPQNLQVGACQFYLDPTHRQPLHPDTMAFLLESRGFRNVRIERLHRASEGGEFSGPNAELLRQLDWLVNGPMDYALIGYKPSFE